MRVFGIPSGVLYSEFDRFARGYKSVGFRSACIDSSIIRNSERLIATGTVLELSALPNLQKLYGKFGKIERSYYGVGVEFQNQNTQASRIFWIMN